MANEWQRFRLDANSIASNCEIRLCCGRARWLRRELEISSQCHDSYELKAVQALAKMQSNTASIHISKTVSSLETNDLISASSSTTREGYSIISYKRAVTNDFHLRFMYINYKHWYKTENLVAVAIVRLPLKAEYDSIIEGTGHTSFTAGVPQCHILYVSSVIDIRSTSAITASRSVYCGNTNIGTIKRCIEPQRFRRTGKYVDEWKEIINKQITRLFHLQWAMLWVPKYQRMMT